MCVPPASLKMRYEEMQFPSVFDLQDIGTQRLRHIFKGLRQLPFNGVVAVNGVFYSENIPSPFDCLTALFEDKDFYPHYKAEWGAIRSAAAETFCGLHVQHYHYFIVKYGRSLRSVDIESGDRRMLLYFYEDTGYHNFYYHVYGVASSPDARDEIFTLLRMVA